MNEYVYFIHIFEVCPLHISLAEIFIRHRLPKEPFLPPGRYYKKQICDKIPYM
jgi:hypothetical protein